MPRYRIIYLLHGKQITTTVTAECIEHAIDKITGGRIIKIEEL